MSQQPYSVELHDSRVNEVCKEGTALVIRLAPAYIHKDGKGWHQEASIVIGSASIEEEFPKLPAKLGGGTMNTVAGPYHNLLHLPLSHEGGVKLTLEFLSGEVARINGIAVEVALKGAPKYVEDFT